MRNHLEMEDDEPPITNNSYKTWSALMGEQIYVLDEHKEDDNGTV
jgi:hypothetical protein